MKSKNINFNQLKKGANTVGSAYCKFQKWTSLITAIVLLVIAGVLAYFTYNAPKDEYSSSAGGGTTNGTITKVTGPTQIIEHRKHNTTTNYKYSVDVCCPQVEPKKTQNVASFTYTSSNSNEFHKNDKVPLVYNKDKQYEVGGKYRTDTPLGSNGWIFVGILVACALVSFGLYYFIYSNKDRCYAWTGAQAVGRLIGGGRPYNNYNYNYNGRGLFDGLLG